MSTSLMVSRTNLVALSSGAQVKIRAVPESQFSKYENDTDILLLGPQVGYSLDVMKKKYEPKDMKVSIISSTDYMALNGENVLKSALAL